jgi:hypothetical protein
VTGYTVETPVGRKSVGPQTFSEVVKGLPPGNHVFPVFATNPNGNGPPAVSNSVDVPVKCDSPDEDCSFYVSGSPAGGWGGMTAVATSPPRWKVWAQLYYERQTQPPRACPKVACIATQITWYIENDTYCPHYFRYAFNSSGMAPIGVSSPSVVPAMQGAICVADRTTLQLPGDQSIPHVRAHGAAGLVQQLQYPQPSGPTLNFSVKPGAVQGNITTGTLYDTDAPILLPGRSAPMCFHAPADPDCQPKGSASATVNDGPWPGN